MLEALISALEHLPICDGLMKPPHPEHERHLCVVWHTWMDVEKLRPLVQNGKFVCKSCGRVAEKSENLCDATPI
jgi:hypothetical protein